MATWHQKRAGMAGLYAPPAKGYAVVIDPPHGLACRVDFSRKRDAARYARKTGGRVISAALGVSDVPADDSALESSRGAA